MLVPTMLPDCKMTTSNTPRQSQPMTMPNVQFVMDHMKLEIRYDMMRGTPAWLLDGAEVPTELEDNVYNSLCDILAKLDVNNQTRLDEILSVFARQNRFHPMEDWMTGLKWDGVDRIEALTASVTTDNPLWPTYIENWLVQVAAAVCGWRDGKQSLPYCLVLVGGQGCGKTHWLRQLGAGWILNEAELHLASSNSKDHQISALQYPMVELSELDGIFRKSDISHMKSFLSRETDILRAPYGRKAIERARVTVFCGSVNEDQFLNDSSGSRRFWPVLVSAIDWGLEVDWAQLWAQVHSFYMENGAFDLTPGENEQRESLAESVHTQESSEVEYLAGFWACHQHVEGSYRAMNVTEILRMLGYKNPWVKTKSDVKKWLTNTVDKPRTISGKQRAWMFPYSDFGGDTSLWPVPILIKSVD